LLQLDFHLAPLGTPTYAQILAVLEFREHAAAYFAGLQLCAGAHLGLYGGAGLNGDGVVDYFDEVERGIGRHGVIRGRFSPMVTCVGAGVTPLP